MSSRLRHIRGFTLIELMIALALIALFATLALPMQELTVKRSREAELRSALRDIRNAIDAYKQAAELGRIAAEIGDSAYPKSLTVLVQGVKDAKNPTGAPIRFLRRIPRDPFADATQRPEDSWGQRSYLSEYDRPQRGADVYDVYSLSNEVGINGVPYREW